MTTHKQLMQPSASATSRQNAPARRTGWRTVLLAPLYGVVSLAALTLLNSLASGCQALYDAARSADPSSAVARDTTDDLTGRVQSVSDGDTFVLRTSSGARLVVRVAEIDAPEQGQPFGNQSKKALSNLVRGREVQLAVQATDSYGRTVARPYVGATDVSAEMVASGSAWVYRRYLRDEHLADLEAQAQAADLGLWGLPASHRQPPWEWRRSHPRKR